VKNVGDFLLRESKSTSEFANSYETGQIIKANNKFGRFKRGEEAVVTNVNTENNTITVKSLTDNSEYTFNPSDYMDGEFSAFTENTSTLGINEKIAFLQNAQLQDKNGKKTDVRNGQIATIVSLDESGNITARVGEGRFTRDVVFNLNKNTESADKYNYIASAYALSSYKSQGMTVDKLIWHANTAKQISSNSFYVAITRCKSEIAVYTDNTEKLRAKAQIEQEKYSTISGNENEIIVGYDSYVDHKYGKLINHETAKEADEKLNAAISYLYLDHPQFSGHLILSQVLIY
jgi:ATP-dependent exoDNAse (exonuclease V) alpha subunit